MKRKTILILGDSTSMTIGVEREMYPFCLADMRSWAPGTRLVNCSLPGFASADACAFFFRNKQRLEPLAAVIIYLGNCDSMSSELHKGKYSPFSQAADYIRSISGKKRGKTRLKNRLLHFEWNDSFDGAIEAPESPEDFEYNISRVVRACEGKDVPVVLVRPQAHVLFPAGIGKGNFVFYKYLGIQDRIADRVFIADDRFKEALRLHENGEFKNAATAYQDILLTSGPLSANQEYQSLVVNNYAVCAAQMNSLDEAEYLLNLLLKERATRKEIILYNLAQVSRLKTNTTGEYRRGLMEACEADRSMYRVRQPYKDVIDKILARFRNVSAIDLKDLAPDECYVDHCHPLPKIQKLIAGHIAEKLRTPELKGDQPMVIENQLYNPEYSLGNMSEFHAYFKTFAPFSSEEIRNFMFILAQRGRLVSDSDSLLEDIPREINTAVEYHLKHPCFPEIKDLIIASPVFPSDVGRFPEYFLFRYLVPYLRIIEKNEGLSRLFAPQTGLLRSSEQFVSILPDSAVTNIQNGLAFDLEYERARLPAILQKVTTTLLKHLKQGNQVYERLKTTIFWYFRETLRFGSHSRISMRYERISLEFMAEALAVAAVLDLKMGGKMRFEIRRLIGWLEEVVQTHESFCREFSLERDCKDLLEQYDAKLMDIAKRVETAAWQGGSRQSMESGKCLS